MRKILMLFEGKRLTSSEAWREKMNWDYSFFIPKNNAFSKQWSKSEDDEASVLIVTEVNRCILCAECREKVGEKGAKFYEIDGKHYCIDCGPKLLKLKKSNEEIAPET